MYDHVIDTVLEAAERWRNPSHEPRSRAVEETLDAANRFTEESVSFAVNQFMHELTRERVERWLTNETVDSPDWVGVAAAGRTPLEGLRDVLGILLVGHRCLVRVPDSSPALIPAFAGEISAEIPEIDLAWCDRLEDVADRASAVVVSGDDVLNAEISGMCRDRGISPDRRLVRSERYGVAVVDGAEDEEARSGLAEDLLLFEGESPCSVRLLWAPEEHTPDPYLAVLPSFREMFPPHQDTDGSLAMPRAFLEARDQGHAYGAGFLISRGEPDVQSGAHIRWSEYDRFETVNTYIREHRGDISLVAAEPRVADHLTTDLAVVEPGQAHRRPLHWEAHPPGLIDWLIGL